MAWADRLSRPVFGLVGLRPAALPLSTSWVARGARQLRGRLDRSEVDVVLATGPPMAGPFAARLGLRGDVPLVVELRDLWAGNPAFDAGGHVLMHLEQWLLQPARRAVVCTPEAVSDLRLRHPDLAGRIVEVPNGFDPKIASIAATGATSSTARGDRTPRALTILHSGTLTPERPLAPLIEAMDDPCVAGSFRLVLHGYLSPASRAEVEWARRETGVSIEVLAPSSWREAVTRIAQADACLITQARAAGDETAIASKVYEYLALAKPVLCMTDGGASEALLRRLEADQLCARLDVPETIVAALLRLREGAPRPVAPERLAPYSRRVLAERMAKLLEGARAG